MKSPPQELIDAFLKWYLSDPHSKNEDYYRETIIRDHLSGLSKTDFIDLFYKFAHEGGQVQSGGYRTSGNFRKMVEANYDQFHSFVLRPFDTNFDEAKWLAETKDFKYFGIGLATIYLNRVDKKRFPILNNKVAESLALFDISLPSDMVKRYKAVLDAQQQLISWFPQFDNFYRADALNQFLIGEEEGQSWKKMLSNGAGPASDLRYWIFQGNPEYYDVIGALRDGALKTWSVNQYKKEIRTGDRVIIWVTGKNSGCYGLATVMSDVQVSEEDSKEASYWIKQTKKVDSEGVTIHIDMNLWNAPVLKAELNDLPAFSDFQAGTQGTNLKIREVHFNGIQNLILGRTQMHYWIYAPGPKAKFWDECCEKGIMVYGADELVDLQTYESKDAIEEALKNTLGKQERPTNDALAAWEFSRVVKPGDIIIAKKGRDKYIGYGIVIGPYVYDASRATYRNTRTVKWVKKGEWDEDGGPIVLKTLTDITKYQEYVEKLKKLMGIEGPIAELALNTILYGPPGTGKSFTLRNKYMKLFTESQMLTREHFAREITGELTWFHVITIVLYDLKSAKVPVIFEHPLLKAKISLQENQSPKNTIWAWLQRHTKIDCPNVKTTQRDEPLIFSKDEQAVWTVDRDMVDEQLPELINVLKSFQEFTPKSEEIKRFEYVTFHQSYCYEDFVEGIKPVMSEDVAETLNYEVKPGIFKRMVKQALDDPNHNYALLIDEINRGNVASIFGELISLIEDDKRKGAENELTAQLPYSRQEFVVPANLYIIGAMNTADRSVEALDTALRRRFTFVAIPPQPELIEQPNNLAVDLRRLLIKINIRIEKLLDKDHCIGHSYFMDIFKSIDPFEKLRSIFAKKILPLLGEYFYNDSAKIGMVLGERFVTRKDLEEEWAAGDWGENDFEERRVYDLKDPMTLNVETFGQFMSNVIQVFEHTTLSVGPQFTSNHFERLVKYNERHGNRYFAVGLNRIHFRNYVGVIQVGSLTIEILPKADKVSDSPSQMQKWQGALIEMIRQSGFIRVASMSDARLRLRSSSLLDIYFESFLAEVDELVHHGLVRKYRQACGNLPALKGRIIFPRHLAKNIVHRERFFTSHVFYDRNNPFNQILRAALDVLVRVSPNPHLVAFARSLAILFDDVDVVEVTERTFNHLPYNRNTERYRRALQLARLIILNYNPDVCGGKEDVLAILFDMNVLFERFVYVQLKRAETKQALGKISFRAQVSRRLWSADSMHKSIRPDIIAQIGTGPDCVKIVMDTKWKIPGDGKPGDADLQQMYAYNVQFGARRSFLLYPKVGTKADIRGKYSRGEALQSSFDHNCDMIFLELFAGDKLRRDIGKDFIEMLTSTE